MRVDWVIPCRYVEVNGNLITIVIGNVDRLKVEQLPSSTPVELLCAIRVVAAHDEVAPEPAEPDHTMTCRVYGPAMDVVSELEQPFGLVGEFQPNLTPAVVMPIRVVFMPQEEGQHTVEIAVDGRGQSAPLLVLVDPEAPDAE